MSFNVLDPNLNLKISRFLEASAGTGKTFAIENLFMRLIRENEEIQCENILVVTFTKAATQDLKTRIKKCLDNARHAVTKVKNIEDLKAALRLEKAIYYFDQAAIFTIHGFCHKVLQESSFEAGFNGQAEDNYVSKEELIDVVRSFLTTENIHFTQLNIVLKHCRGKIQKLQESLLQAILKGVEIIPGLSYEQTFNSFKEFFKQHTFEADKVLQDFIKLSPQYLGICDRIGQPKKENLEKIATFAALFEKECITNKDFDQQLKDGLYVYSAFLDSQKKASAKMPELHYLELLTLIQEKLWPIIRDASDFMAIFANLAAGCQKKLYSYLEENNKLEFSFLLKKMQQAVSQNLVLREKIREQYKVVIIDEFQDTDPLQWDIFNQLFLAEQSKTLVYLVGDPKQSIYSFRSADIYTYLAAEKAINAKNTLQVNYRSQPSLIRALNGLFNEENAPGWMDLPHHSSHLPYLPVFHAEKNKDRFFKDTLGSVHFCVATAEKNEDMQSLEERVFFPYVTQEIKRLNILEHVAFHEIAILVHDRFQAKRLLKALSNKNIPGILQRTGSLVQSSMLPALLDLLIGILQPKQESLFKAAICGKIIGFNHEQLQQIANDVEWSILIEKALFLRESWQKKGLGHFFKEFLDSKWDTITILEKLLSREDGANAYDELMNLVSLLLEYECNEHATPEKIVQYIEGLLTTNDLENEDHKIQQDVTKDAVQVLTIHASKGLEYGIVFALGLCHRTPVKETLIQSRSDKNALKYFPIDSQEALIHKRECDAEKMRQLYVALTRAKHRVYIPCVRGWKAPKQGIASPVELLLARLHQPLCDYEELYQRLQKDVLSRLQFDKDITVSDHIEKDDRGCNLESTPLLVKPEKIPISGQTLFSSSFSSMALTMEQKQKVEFVPRDYDASTKTIQTLPAGRETGLLFHEILEKMHFDIEESQISAFVYPFLKDTLYENWLEVFVSTLAQVLGIPFLKGLTSENCFREMEFLFPNELIKDFPPGFINGIVDLVFMYENKYYLLDWKTNWLESYSFDAMHQAMLANQYHLQAEIYTQALKQYVKLFDIRPFDECYGGAYYIFLRGLQQGTSLGIYHFLPNVKPLYIRDRHA